MIEFSNLVVALKTIKITFKDSTFTKGNVTIITGKNGTGKTTLLKTIAGFYDYEGSLIINGEVTYNSEETVIFNRTVFENIVYPLRIRKLDISTYEDKIKEYARVLEIDHLLHKNALKLSSGEKRKVSIIRSIIFQPAIVLLDEPTTHLDLDSINELIRLLKKLKQDMTFIIVSHNETFIQELQDVIYKVGEQNVCS